MNELKNIIRSGQRTYVSDSLEFNYDVVVETKKKKDIWFATAPSLKSLGYSKTGIKEAVIDQFDDVEVFFKVHEHLGSLEKALKGFGWKKGISKKNEIVFYHKDLKSVIKYKHKRKP